MNCSYIFLASIALMWGAGAKASSAPAKALATQSHNLLERYRSITNDCLDLYAQGLKGTEAIKILNRGINAAEMTVQLSRRALHHDDVRNIAVMYLSLACHEENRSKNLGRAARYFKQLIQDFPNDTNPNDYLGLVNTCMNLACSCDPEAATLYWKESSFYLPEGMNNLRPMTVQELKFHLPYAVKIQKFVKKCIQKQIALAEPVAYKLEAYLANVRLLLAERERNSFTSPSPASATSPEPSSSPDADMLNVEYKTKED